MYCAEPGLRESAARCGEYIEIQAREILRTRHALNELYVKHTGQELDTIERAMDRDKFMSSDEAKVFGLIDEVADKRPLPTDAETLKAA